MKKLCALMILLFTVSVSAAEMPKAFLGKWKCDVKSTVAELKKSPEFKKLPKAQQDQQIKMMSAMMGSMKFEIKANEIINHAEMFGQKQTDKKEIKIKSAKDKSVELTFPVRARTVHCSPLVL